MGGWWGDAALNNWYARGEIVGLRSSGGYGLVYLSLLSASATPCAHACRPSWVTVNDEIHSD